MKSKDLQRKKHSLTREQVLLETLQANISPESTPETEITQETGTDPKPTEVPDTSSAQEKVVHYSEDQVKDIVADYFKSLPIACQVIVSSANI